MLRGLWKLTWLEAKIFAREPMGLIGTLVVPVLVFVLLGRVVGRLPSSGPRAIEFLGVGLPVLASIMIAVNAVASLVTIVSIYREGGILKRLRATPLSPVTILTAHVLVKLGLTVVTLALLLLAGRRYYPADVDPPMLTFGIALLIVTWSVLSIGFLVSAMVPTARFANLIAGLVLYPMLAISGLFFPLTLAPPAVQAVAAFNPLTYAVRLLQGVWTGAPLAAHGADIAALVIVFVISTLVASRVFRWE